MYREADPAEVMHEYGIKTITHMEDNRLPSLSRYSAIILAVAHNEFLSIDLKTHKDNGAIICDVKGILRKGLTDGRL